MHAPGVASRSRPVNGRRCRSGWKIPLTFALAFATSHQVLGQTPAINAVPQGNPIERVEPRQLPPVSPNGINLAPPEQGEVPNVPINVRRVEIVGGTLVYRRREHLISVVCIPKSGSHDDHWTDDGRKY